MTYAANQERVLVPRNTKLFLKAQTDKDTLAVPSGTDVLRLNEDASFTYPWKILENEQKMNTRSRLLPKVGKLGHGEMDLSNFYLKGTNGAGRTPREDVLLAAAIGPASTMNVDAVNDANARVHGFVVDTASDFAAGEPRMVALGTNFEGFMVERVPTEVACTFTNGTDVVNAVAHGLPNGTKIRFKVTGVGALPATLSLATTYYVINAAANTFQLSLTQPGVTASVVLFADDGTAPGQFYCTELAATPPLSAAPADNAQILGGRKYELDATQDLGYFSTWFQMDSSVFAMVGCAVGSLTLDVTMDELFKASASLGFIKMIYTNRCAALKNIIASSGSQTVYPKCCNNFSEGSYFNFSTTLGTALESQEVVTAINYANSSSVDKAGAGSGGTYMLSATINSIRLSIDGRPLTPNIVVSGAVPAATTGQEICDAINTSLKTAVGYGAEYANPDLPVAYLVNNCVRIRSPYLGEGASVQIVEGTPGTADASHVIFNRGDVLCTTTFGTDKVNKTAHGLYNGQKVKFYAGNGGVLPSPIAFGTAYYIINRAADNFEITTSIAGVPVAVNIADDGTAPFYYYLATQPLARTYASMTVTKTGVIGQTTCQANSSTYDRDATGAAPGTFDTDAPCNFKLGFNGGSDLAIALSASDTMPVHAVVDEINEALLADLVYFKYYGCCTYTGMGGGDAVRITHPEGGVANYFTLTDGTANSCLNVIFTAAAGPYTCTGVDVYLDPYLPTATDQGEPIACKKGYLRMRDGVQFPVKSAQIVINNNLEWMDDEKNDSDYSSGKLDGSRREISLTMKMYWREKYAKAFGQAINFEDNSLFFEVGSQNYSIWAGCVPSFKLQVPKPGNTESGKELDLEGIVYGDNARWGSTTYDNEFVLGAF